MGIFNFKQKREEKKRQDQQKMRNEMIYDSMKYFIDSSILTCSKEEFLTQPEKIEKITRMYNELTTFYENHKPIFEEKFADNVIDYEVVDNARHVFDDYNRLLKKYNETRKIMQTYQIDSLIAYPFPNQFPTFEEYYHFSDDEREELDLNINENANNVRREKNKKVEQELYERQVKWADETLMEYKKIQAKEETSQGRKR